MPFNVIIYLKTISNIIELYKINILWKIMPVSNYLFVIIINSVRPPIISYYLYPDTANIKPHT